MELVDVGDSKSPGSDTVSVRVRPEALKRSGTCWTFFYEYIHCRQRNEFSKMSMIKRRLSYGIL